MKNLLLLTAALTGAAALLLVNRRPLSAAVADGAILEALVSEASRVLDACGYAGVSVPFRTDPEASYTVDKSEVRIRVRDPRTGLPHQFNDLIYVTLHELAHVINTRDVHHSDEFYSVFDGLVRCAASMGVYDPARPFTYSI